MSAVAQSAWRPELRSVKEVQLSRREFDSRLRQKTWGKNPSQAICEAKHMNSYKSADWASNKKLFLTQWCNWQSERLLQTPEISSFRISTSREIFKLIYQGEVDIFVQITIDRKAKAD